MSSHSMGGEQRNAAREFLHARSSGKCEYCGKPISLKVGTIDHYVPCASGGTSQRDNLRWSCFNCNNAKGAMTPKEWLLVKPPYKHHASTRYEIKVALLSAAIQRERQRNISQQPSA